MRKKDIKMNLKKKKEDYRKSTRNKIFNEDYTLRVIRTSKFLYKN